MAGGPHASVVLCPNCAGRSERTSEGAETDWYRCESCKHVHGIDWSAGFPDTPCWPPSPAELAAVQANIARKGAQKAQ